MNAETIGKASSESMNPNMKRLALFCAIFPTLLSPGCIADMVMKSQDRQHYTDYVTETQRLNFDREKAGLAPQKIMTFNEWNGGK
jgi:hypothetical protein